MTKNKIDIAIKLNVHFISTNLNNLKYTLPLNSTVKHTLNFNRHNLYWGMVTGFSLFRPKYCKTWNVILKILITLKAIAKELKIWIHTRSLTILIENLQKIIVWTHILSKVRKCFLINFKAMTWKSLVYLY